MSCAAAAVLYLKRGEMFIVKPSVEIDRISMGRLVARTAACLISSCEEWNPEDEEPGDCASTVLVQYLKSEHFGCATSMAAQADLLFDYVKLIVSSNGPWHWEMGIPDRALIVKALEVFQDWTVRRIEAGVARMGSDYRHRVGSALLGRTDWTKYNMQFMSG